MTAPWWRMRTSKSTCSMFLQAAWHQQVIALHKSKEHVFGPHGGRLTVVSDAAHQLIIFSCCSDVLRVSDQKLKTMAVAPGCKNMATVPKPPEGVISTDVWDMRSSCA